MPDSFDNLNEELYRLNVVYRVLNRRVKIVLTKRSLVMEKLKLAVAHEGDQTPPESIRRPQTSTFPEGAHVRLQGGRSCCIHMVDSENERLLVIHRNRASQWINFMDVAEVLLSTKPESVA